MGIIRVYVGDEGRRSRVEGIPFLPGLYAHKPPVKRYAPQGAYNITHGESGLAVLRHIPEEQLEVVRMILGRMTWDKPSRVIFYDRRYQKLTEEVLATLTNHQASERQEKKIEKDIDGKRQPASGSRWGAKRDIITPSVLIEAKTTRKTFYRLSLRDLSFLRKQAYGQAKIPVYIISVGGLEDIAIMPMDDIPTDLIGGAVVTTMGVEGRKHLRIDAGLCETVGRHQLYRIKTDRFTYLVLDYERFLKFAKQGAP